MVSNTRLGIAWNGVVFLSKSLSGRVKEFAGRLLDDGVPLLPSESVAASWEELLAIIDGAKQEWIDAQEYFDAAIEPELVDHAILTLQAAERKYMYWLNQIKNLE